MHIIIYWRKRAANSIVAIKLHSYHFQSPPKAGFFVVQIFIDAQRREFMFITSTDTSTTKYSSAPGDLSLAKLKMTLPTGRIETKVTDLLKQIGLTFLSNGRSYRPLCNDTSVEAKMLRAKNIPGLVALGKHDCGFTGHDWVVEQDTDIVELLDLGFDPVRIVAAMPEQLGDISSLQNRQDSPPLIVASEYSRLADNFIKKWNLNAIFIHAYGATEALPPEDADIIIDNTSSGTTLRHNRLVIVDEIMQSSTRFICNKEALADPVKRSKLEELTMLMKSTIQAKNKVFLEMNVSIEDFDQLVKTLPCMKAPTVSQLYDGSGFAVKVAVDSGQVPSLVPQLLTLGARDILEYKVDKIINKVSL